MSDPQHFSLGELGQRVQAMSDPAATPANGPVPASASDPHLRPYQGSPLPIGPLSSRGPLTPPAATAGPIAAYEPREDLRIPPPAAAPVPPVAAGQFGRTAPPAPFSPPTSVAAGKPFAQPRASESISPPNPESNFAPSYPRNSAQKPPAPAASSWEEVALPSQPAQQPRAGSSADFAGQLKQSEQAEQAEQPEQPEQDRAERAAGPPPAKSQDSATPAEPAKSGFQRAIDAVRSAIPVVQKLLPLLDGNFATAMGALMAPQNHPAPPPVQVDFEPVERGLAEVRNSNRELRAQVLEQGTTLKRVEDQLDRVREATDRNTLEQQELVEDLRAVGSRISTLAILGVILLLISLGLNGYLIFELQHILR